MKTFQEFSESVATDLGQKIVGKGMSKVRGNTLAHLLKAVRIAIAEDSSFIKRLIAFLGAEGSAVQDELSKANMDQLNDDAFMSNLRTAAKTGLSKGNNDSEVAPNHSDMPT